ncbi:MAG: hypothetical protein QOF33_4189 [Thermomicrobiales bacterium]|jgi:hypothetical protein|nr:hypothetical protein [Thermomicrobiales bacterium]
MKEHVRSEDQQVEASRKQYNERVQQENSVRAEVVEFYKTTVSDAFHEIQSEMRSLSRKVDFIPADDRRNEISSGLRVEGGMTPVVVYVTAKLHGTNVTSTVNGGHVSTVRGRTIRIIDSQPGEGSVITKDELISQVMEVYIELTK